MLRVDVKKSMTLSIVCAVILCVVFQHRSAAEIIRIMLTGYRAGIRWLAQMINGGGLLSMKKVLMIVCMTSTYSGIFSGTGMLDGITEYVKQSQKTEDFFMYRAAFCCYKYGRMQSDNRDHDDRAAGLCFV